MAKAVSFITEENWGVVKLPVSIECVFTGMLLFWNDGRIKMSGGSACGIYF